VQVAEDLELVVWLAEDAEELVAEEIMEVVVEELVAEDIK
jgi:hypothetical protein